MLLTKAQLLSNLRAKVRGYRDHKTAAKRLGISPQYLSDVLHERREPGPKLLKGLKYRREVGYRPLPPE